MAKWLRREAATLLFLGSSPSLRFFLTMDVKDAIGKRRSIRSYQDKSISNELIRELIDAARLAPSGNNAQPGRYFIVNDEETKSKLRENEIFKQDFVYEAPVIIACCADPRVYSGVKGWDDSNNVRAIRDLSIASFSLVLRATEMGLGTCYVGWVKKEEIKSILGIPDNYIVPYVITVGYPAEEPGTHSRKGIDEIIIR